MSKQPAWCVMQLQCISMLPQLFVWLFFSTCSSWICFNAFNFNLFESPSYKAKLFPQDHRKHLLLIHPPSWSLSIPRSFFTAISHSNGEQQISCFRHKVKNLISLLFFVSIVIWNPNAFLLILLFPNLIVNNHSFFSMCFVVRYLPPYPPSLSSLLPTAYFHVQEGIPTLASLQWMRSGIT